MVKITRTIEASIYDVEMINLETKEIIVFSEDVSGVQANRRDTRALKNAETHNHGYKSLQIVDRRVERHKYTMPLDLFMEMATVDDENDNQEVEE